MPNADYQSIYRGSEMDDRWGKAGTAVQGVKVNGTEVSKDAQNKVNLTLNKSAVGLGNVDNTSDANKPVSTAQAAAIAAETEARTQGDGMLDTAVRSLQSQIDSVASRDGFDELYVSTLSADVVVAQNIYGNFHGNLHGNADSATNATNATYATYDAEAENIADNFSVIGQALKSLQSQIDSVASRDLAELTEAIIYLKMKVEELANS